MPDLAPGSPAPAGETPRATRHHQPPHTRHTKFKQKNELKETTSGPGTCRLRQRSCRKNPHSRFRSRPCTRTRTRTATRRSAAAISTTTANDHMTWTCVLLHRTWDGTDQHHRETHAPIVLMPCTKLTASEPGAGIGPHRICAHHPPSAHGNTRQRHSRHCRRTRAARCTRGAGAAQRTAMRRSSFPTRTCAGSAFSLDESPANSAGIGTSVSSVWSTDGRMRYSHLQAAVTHHGDGVNGCCSDVLSRTHTESRYQPQTTTRRHLRALIQMTRTRERGAAKLLCIQTVRYLHGTCNATRMAFARRALVTVIHARSTQCEKPRTTRAPHPLRCVSTFRDRALQHFAATEHTTSYQPAKRGKGSKINGRQRALQHTRRQIGDVTC